MWQDSLCMYDVRSTDVGMEDIASKLDRAASQTCFAHEIHQALALPCKLC